MKNVQHHSHNSAPLLGAIAVAAALLAVLYFVIFHPSTPFIIGGG